MSITSTRFILKVLQLFAQMPVGEGWVNPVDVVKYSGVSHSTVYRYLPKMEKEGLVMMEEYTCRKMKCKRYHITSSGWKYLEGVESGRLIA